MPKISVAAASLAIIISIAAAPSITAQQGVASTAPKPPAASAPAAEVDVLAQLQPPPTAAELAAYKEVKTKQPDAIPQFILTRKYFRQLWAASPNGKLDPKTAPKPSDKVSYAYALDFREQMILLSMILEGGTSPANSNK
ncbi:MAG TPA: hypothetical protein VFB10_03475 [Candidatus Dormibacteraeota bacterium]|nr:hypothetical protein [Candidatus Dormibacteraeota bacterium]